MGRRCAAAMRKAHDFDRARRRSKNSRSDASEEESADGPTAVRTDQNEVRTPLRGKLGDDAARRARKHFRSRREFGLREKSGTGLDDLFTLAFRVVDQYRQFREAANIDSRNDHERTWY